MNNADQSAIALSPPIYLTYTTTVSLSDDWNELEITHSGIFEYFMGNSFSISIFFSLSLSHIIRNSIRIFVYRAVYPSYACPLDMAISIEKFINTKNTQKKKHTRLLHRWSYSVSSYSMSFWHLFEFTLRTGTQMCLGIFFGETREYVGMLWYWSASFQSS